MRVLWFTNIELPAVARRLSGQARLAGGWMEGLRLALQGQESLELGVAATGRTPFEPFDEDGCPLLQPTGPRRPSTASGRSRGQWKHGVSDGPALGQRPVVVDGFQPDLIHVHGSEGPMGLLAGMVEQPVLLSLQGILTVCERFYFAGVPASEVVRDAASLHFLKGQGMIHGRWSMQAAARRELRSSRPATTSPAGPTGPRPSSGWPTRPPATTGRARCYAPSSTPAGGRPTPSGRTVPHLLHRVGGSLQGLGQPAGSRGPSPRPPCAGQSNCE